MKTITFIGDPHFFHIAPSSRRDDYPSIVLDKMMRVKEESPSDAYIFLGDVFHKQTLPMRYLVRVATTLLLMDKPIYSIVGNHDVPRYNVDKIDETSLGLFFKTGLIRRLTELKFKVGSQKYYIKGIDYRQPIPKAPKVDRAILVLHAFYQHTAIKTSETKITDKQLADSGFHHIIFGHDHAKYDPVTTDAGQMVYRPGSLTRGTAHHYNLLREISVLRMQCMSSGLNIKMINIPSDPVKVSFEKKVTSKGHKSLKDMVGFIRSFLSSSASTQCPYKILDEIEIENPDVRKHTETLLFNYGFVRK